jgi:hypothetical protein
MNGVVNKIALCFIVREKPYNKSIWDPFIRDSRYNIYIHSSFEQNNEWGEFYIDTRWPSSWANNARAQKSVLEYALKDNKDNYKFVSLSESCLPLQTPDHIYHFLTSNDNCYLNCAPCWFGPGVVSRYLDFVPRENFYIGSQWYILNRDICEFMEKDKTFIDQVITRTDDSEQYLPTLLSLKNKLDKVTPQTTTLVDWRTGGCSPYTFPLNLDANDQEILLQAKKNGLLFARKFNEGANLDFLL